MINLEILIDRKYKFLLDITDYKINSLLHYENKKVFTITIKALYIKKNKS
jgi:hypothetical protein